MSETERWRAAVVGGSGYTGAELVRLLLGHPRFELGPICGSSRAGAPVASVLPSLAGIVDGQVEKFEPDAVAAQADVAFCGLPHGASAGIVSELRDRGLVVFDLSADFRLRDLAVYEKWYGEHQAPQRFGEAVYGLVELHREALKGADLVAVPGCYPTASTLALAPLLRGRLVDPQGIVVDAKSGVSGAGRKLGDASHFAGAAEGMRAYKAAAHRHTPEIEQELSAVADAKVLLTFVPHLTPMIRGIAVTAYAMAKSSGTALQATTIAREMYAGSPSVVVHEPGVHPDTLWVRGSNRAHISYIDDERTGRVLALSAIDNLLKGAAGQAIQGANVRFGLPEGLGIDGPAMWP